MGDAVLASLAQAVGCAAIDARFRRRELQLAGLQEWRHAYGCSPGSGRATRRAWRRATDRGNGSVLAECDNAAERLLLAVGGVSW